MPDSPQISDNTFRKKVTANHPDIASRYNGICGIKSLDSVTELFARFQEMEKHIPKSWFGSKCVFIGFILYLDNPEYFREMPIRKRLRQSIARATGMTKTNVSHYFVTVKNYYDIYPSFRSEVLYIYNEMIKE